MNYKLALIGFGGVNRALVDLIMEKQVLLKKEHDLMLDIVAVSDIYFGSIINEDGLDLTKLSSLPQQEGALAHLQGGRKKADNQKLIVDGNADIIVEATFTNPETGEPAVSHCRSALNSGKHVITTNKGPIALYGQELSLLGGDNNAIIEYEGTVMSGTPVIGLAKNCLKGCEINGFKGILNGTANYILGRIEQGCGMDEAIKEAQEQGYAEADPTADIEGYDVMLKVTILANQLLGGNLKPTDIAREGIAGLTEDMIKQATRQGNRWKLIGKASKQKDGQIEASVSPICLNASDSLAGISGPVNAVSFETDLLGEVTISGPGAGKIETAYALLTDILAIHTKRG